MTDAEVMSQFESLGQNCEFGQAQRMAGIEPFGLFRWANTPTSVLLRLLKCDFAGFGESIDLEVGSPEWVTYERNFGWSMHTWTNPDSIGLAAMREKETRRLSYLRERMLALLGEASRIFVLKSPTPLVESVVLDAHFELMRYGPNTLLYVEDGSSKPEITVERDWLLYGQIPQFAHRDDVPHTTRGADWVKLCRMALEIKT